MKSRLCVFGEVLFDHFPDGHDVLGGAPFNVAWHLQAFGQAPYFISRVANDVDGHKIIHAMQDWNMNTQGLQTDSEYPTGRVNIEFIDAEPVYDILNPAAFDTIKTDTSSTNGCGFLYHGTLALRNEASNNAFTQLLKSRPEKVFIDVNLRDPWWQVDTVRHMIKSAQWVKLNIHEFDLVYPSQRNLSQRAADFLSDYNLQGVILTQGAKGAMVMTQQHEQFSVKPESKIEIIDSVGAGDAFASVMIVGIKNNWPLCETLQRAQTFASAIVGNPGATVLNKSFYRHFINQWKLDIK